MLLTSSFAAASMLALIQLQPSRCDETFHKRGSPLTGLRFVAERSVADLSRASAVGQLRGIVSTKGYTIMTEEPEAGTMLIEQPMTGKARAFPIEIRVTETVGGGTVRMEARLRTGMMVGESAARMEMCGILARLKGGAAGLALAEKGRAAQSAMTAPIRMSVLRFSSLIAGEARNSSVAIEPRYKGRTFTLFGPVASVTRAGDRYRVDFRLVENMVSGLVPGSGFRLDVSCLLGKGQSTFALSLKPNRHVELSGVFDAFDEGRSVVVLRDCAPAT